VARLQRASAAALAAARDAGWNTGSSDGTAIIPIIFGQTERAVLASVRLLEAGINAAAVAYPAVPEEDARIRLFMSADHTGEHIARFIAALATV